MLLRFIAVGDISIGGYRPSVLLSLQASVASVMMGIGVNPRWLVS